MSETNSTAAIGWMIELIEDQPDSTRNYSNVNRDVWISSVVISLLDSLRNFDQVLVLEDSLRGLPFDIANSFWAENSGSVVAIK